MSLRLRSKKYQVGMRISTNVRGICPDTGVCHSSAGSDNTAVQGLISAQPPLRDHDGRLDQKPKQAPWADDNVYSQVPIPFLFETGGYCESRVVPVRRRSPCAADEGR